MINGFLPTPYPDECLYSILCRYYARIGDPAYKKVSQILFGTRQNLSATIYLPIKLERVDSWIPPESGINRFSIAAYHTMYPYFEISNTLEMRTEVEKVLNGGIPAPKHDNKIVHKYKDKCIKIGRESEWLLENGLFIDWQKNGRDKYLKLFRDSKLASLHGTRSYPSALSDAINNYWGHEFLSALFLDTNVLPKWLSYIHITQGMMSQFLPLQHILLMCVAKGSAKDFVNSEVVDNPFGNAPYICENPICEHYHARSAVCLEFRYFSIEVIGIFHFLTCA